MNIKHSFLLFMLAFIAISSFAHAEKTYDTHADIENAAILENYDADIFKKSVNMMILENKNDVTKAIETVMAETPLVKKFFGNERINIRIDDFGDYNIELKDGKVESIGEGKNEKPTLEISTDFETVKNLTDGNIDLFEAINNGKMKYEGVGFFSSIKYKLIGFLVTKVGPIFME